MSEDHNNEFTPLHDDDFIPVDGDYYLSVYGEGGKCTEYPVIGFSVHNPALADLCKDGFEVRPVIIWRGDPENSFIVKRSPF